MLPRRSESGRQHSTAEEPVTARIRRRTSENLAVRTLRSSMRPPESITRILHPDACSATFQERIAMERQQNPVAQNAPHGALVSHLSVLSLTHRILNDLESTQP